MVIIDAEIISLFKGEVISKCVDVSWMKIKEAVKHSKNKNQNIESQIYNVVVNVLNQITYNKFENNQDKIYQAAENILMGYKDERCDNIEAVRSGLQILDESVTRDKYMKFNTVLNKEISRSDYEELYRQIRILQQDGESSKTSRIEKKIDKVQQSADEINRRLDAFQENNMGINNVQDNEPVKSRTHEYFDKWNANMFLNDFDEWDEKAGVNVKLSDVYIDDLIPHFVWGGNENLSRDLKSFLYKYIMENSENKMLLILGQPGIGKSTLITWIVSNYINRINDIMVFQFASDLKGVDWQNKSDKYDLFSVMLSRLNLSYSGLKGKILILDGFDEVNINYGREDILNYLYQRKKNFSLIITCRENYIQNLYNVSCRYITLQPWDDVQIQRFCDVYLNITAQVVPQNTMLNILENKLVLGIPLILYMVLALDISIEKKDDIVDIYDQIFSLERGIYDRCIKGISYEEPHRISQIKEQIHFISKKISIWIFENEPEKTFIPHGEYEKICDQVSDVPQNVNIHLDFKIGNFFKMVRHCEEIETEKLYFVHRTIYEYFVAESIYASIKNAMLEMTVESQNDLNRNLSIYLKKGIISNKINEFLTYKIVRLYADMETDKKSRFYKWWEKAVEKMLVHGMFYYTNENIAKYDNIIHKEIRCFINIIEILRSLLNISDKKYIMTYIEKAPLENYIKYSIMISNIWKQKRLNLSRMSLVGFNLNRMNIEDVDFSRGDLTEIKLKGARLLHILFNNAIMIDANLENTDLNDVNFEGADLRKANFNNAKLTKVKLGNADLRGADFREVYIDNISVSSAVLTGTMWSINSVKSVLNKLVDTIFEYIYVDDGYERKKIYRSSVFTNLSFFL